MSGLVGSSGGGGFHNSGGSGYHGNGGSGYPGNETVSATHPGSTDKPLLAIVQHAFKDDLHFLCGTVTWLHGQLLDVQTFLRLCLERQELRHCKAAELWRPDGRLGPQRVHFDKKNYVGTFSFHNDPLGLNSQDNFSTIRANTCVFKGKWQYELMLGTKGVMQVGWATNSCQFSQEKGVGDTADSYAYDGNRQRKWNVATYKYGAMWQCGDIITCTMDLDNGVVSFFRNGKALGPAFDNVKVGPGVAYFPAVSLALGESLSINFGGTPFRYRQEGFQPLEAPPAQQLIKANTCVNLLRRLVDVSTDWDKHPDLKCIEERWGLMRCKACILIIVQHITTHLGPLLATPYVVEHCLVPSLASLSLAGVKTVADPSSGTEGLHLQESHVLLDFLMASLEDHELLKCLENLIICLLTYHKQASASISFSGQKYSLRLLYVVLSHRSLRKYCLNHILFDKVRFPSFVNIKCIDEEGLAAAVPEVWWASKDGQVSQGNKEAYTTACNKIKKAVQEVEQTQVSILRLLLSATDFPTYQESSRALFLAKFRSFLKEHTPGFRVSSSGYTPLPVILCLFHRLLTIFAELWAAESQERVVSIPPRLFYDGSLSYFDTHRLGGLESHLKKTLSKEVARALRRNGTETSKVINKLDEATASAGTPIDVDMPSTSGAMLGDPILAAEANEGVQRVDVTSSDLEDKPEGGSNARLVRDSLLHLLDGIILLYHIGAHKQLGKVAAQRDSMSENVSHVLDIDKKMAHCTEKGLSPSLVEELQGSREVFLVKLEEQARQQAWVLAAVHSPDKYTQLVSVMQLILSTLKEASREGKLFGFVPDFYVESLTEMCTALRLYFTAPPENAAGSKALLMSVGEFLALHFCDSRIVYADSKDSLIQALAGFVCHQTTLTALEEMPLESRQQMVRNLLQPYENRAWAQNNWILVRFWKGCGFGFRYTKSPHMSNKFGPKPAHSENPNFTQATAPSPSPTFQRHIVEILESSADVATPFLNSLINQLNWAFSEFIGMLQEIQNASNRPERVFIDSRQLRICATCFDLALALLRVIEMIVNISPQLFTDFSMPNAEGLLTRLLQLLCQVLNRVTGTSGCFAHVVALEIPGLETIHHYPILTAVTGILVTLLSHDLTQSVPKLQVATKTLLNEPSFQVTSIYQLLGGQDIVKSTPGSAAANTKTTTERSCQDVTNEVGQLSVSGVRGGQTSNTSSSNKFSLRNYPDDVTSQEIVLVERVIGHLETSLETRSEPTPGEDEDSLCTICYAYQASATFEPCHHSSCRACVTHHLMNRTDCFFCKTTIQAVKDQADGAFIYQAPTSQTSADGKDGKDRL